MIQKNRLATKPGSRTENENKTREKNTVSTQGLCQTEELVRDKL